MLSQDGIIQSTTRSAAQGENLTVDVDSICFCVATMAPEVRQEQLKTPPTVHVQGPGELAVNGDGGGEGGAPRVAHDHRSQPPARRQPPW